MLTFKHLKKKKVGEFNPNPKVLEYFGSLFLGLYFGQYLGGRVGGEVVEHIPKFWGSFDIVLSRFEVVLYIMVWGG